MAPERPGGGKHEARRHTRARDAEQGKGHRVMEHFVVTYHQPPEPMADEPVIAATITLQTRSFCVSVARRNSHWQVYGVDQADRMLYDSYLGAVTAAHLSAYLYATDLASLQFPRAFG